MLVSFRGGLWKLDLLPQAWAATCVRLHLFVNAQLAAETFAFASIMNECNMYKGYGFGHIYTVKFSYSVPVTPPVAGIQNP